MTANSLIHYSLPHAGPVSVMEIPGSAVTDWLGNSWLLFGHCLYGAGNAVTTHMPAHDLPEPVRDSVSVTYQPKTALGQRLLALRRAFVEKGGQLLDADMLDEEMRQRRGGVADA